MTLERYTTAQQAIMADGLYWEPHDSGWETLHPLDEAIEIFYDQREDDLPETQRVTFDAHRMPAMTLDAGYMIEHATERLFDCYGYDDGMPADYQPSAEVLEAMAVFVAAICADWAAKRLVCLERASDVPSVTVDVTASGDYTIAAFLLELA